jgi:hypothetical protein
MKNIAYLIVLLINTITYGQNSYPTSGVATLSSGDNQSLIIRDARSGTNWNYLEWQFNNGTRDWVLGRRYTTGNFTLWREGLNEVLTVDNLGNIGIGTTSPIAKLDVRGASNFDGGRLTLQGSMPNDNNAVFTNSAEGGYGIYSKGGLNTRYSFHFENQQGTSIMYGRGDGKVGIGTTTPKQNLHVKGRFYLEGTEAYPSGWLQNYFHWRGHSLIMGSEVGEYAHNTIELKPGGSTSGSLDSHLQLYATPSPNNYNLKIQLSSNGNTFFNGGNVGIGTETPNQKLTVNGTIYGKEVKVDLNVPGPDYVFESTYNLSPLTEIETYIKANKHLPEVPSAKEMEANGINLSEMNMLLLKKVEELTLHLIELKKENEMQKKSNNELKKDFEDFKSRVNEKN